MPVSTEARVEDQKLNQFAAHLPLGWDFGVQLDYSKGLSKNYVAKSMGLRSKCLSALADTLFKLYGMSSWDDDS